MPLILTKITPNNKLQLKHYRLADGFFRKKGGGDTQREKDLERIGRITAEIEGYTEYLRNSIELKKYYLPSRKEGEITFEAGSSSLVLAEELVQVDYCQLPPPQLVSFVNPNNGESEVVKASYWEVIERRLRALDLLKKSQYAPKKERPWGKKQTPKVFRYQAGEKIKEGGAVIDRFVGAKNAHMITLTLPGSTFESMEALSRWSGWIVNRLIQVIRNLKKEYKQVYWFFVWEHQKRGALHLHFCLGWKVWWLKRENLAHKLKDKFYGLLEEIGTREGIDMFARKGGDKSWRFQPEKWQWDIQRVKKSVSAYFAKYCQKNADNQSNNGDKQTTQRRGNDFFEESENSSKTGLYPSRYWGSSRTIKDWCKFLCKQHKISFDCDNKAANYIGSIREKIGGIFNFKGVYVNDFQLEDEKSKRVIVSGKVESFIVHPCDYVDFWVYCMDAVIGRDLSQESKFDELLRSQSNDYVDLTDSFGILALV